MKIENIEIKRLDSEIKPTTVWHYTKTEYLPRIEETGALLPKSEAEYACTTPIIKGVYISSVPLVWFSSDQLWEHATSQLNGTGYRSQSWQKIAYEMKAIRYGISINDPRLINWEKTCELAGANREERRQRKMLIPQARKAGSNPALWFSSPVPIPLEDLNFEMWLNGNWKKVDRALIRRKLYELGKLETC